MKTSNKNDSEVRMNTQVIVRRIEKNTKRRRGCIRFRFRFLRFLGERVRIVVFLREMPFVRSHCYLLRTGAKTLKIRATCILYSLGTKIIPKPLCMCVKWINVLKGSIGLWGSRGFQQGNKQWVKMCAWEGGCNWFQEFYYKFLQGALVLVHSQGAAQLGNW